MPAPTFHCRRRPVAPAGDPMSRFQALKSEFDARLAELAALSEDHFGADPEGLTWADVGDMERNVADLRVLTDRLFRRGEYAA